MNSLPRSAASRTNPDDYAVLIGVSDYTELRRLDGPTNDVHEFSSWLTDPNGGGLPEDNVTAILTSPDAPSDGRGATLEDVNQAFNRLWERAEAGGGPVGRRLYLLASGHGYLSLSKGVALLLADASPSALGNAIGVTQYANYFRDSGAFEEVVLIADCDQTIESEAVPQTPPWPEPTFDNVLKPAASFYVFAAGPGETSWEGFVTAAGGKTQAQGYLTHAFIEGLRGGAAAPDGSVTSDTLMDYLSPQLVAMTETKQPPYFITEAGPIVFVEPAEAERKPGVQSAQPRAHERARRQRVVTQADDPATVDELGRRPFAEVIAARIEEVWRAQAARADAGGAFMVHLHGPWGSGKTSVLNFLRAHLQDESREESQRWVVVEYNAWRNQRVRPPWWTLIKEIYTQSARQLGLLRSLWLRVQWLVWRVRADLLPALSAVVLVVLAVLLATGVINLSTATPTANAGQPAVGGSDKVVAAVELGLKILAAAVAAGAAIFALSRSLVFGSARAAQTYTELRSDPLGPIVRLFQKLVRAIRRPVLVLVDDMDRCDGNYVVELLEGIQTLFRTAPVTYVVAADRKWICSSFEKGFADFGKTIGEPGRPLGYLFLDKVFQVSASIPRLSPEARARYWKGLLRSAGSADPRKVEDTRRRIEREVRGAVNLATTQEELEEKIAGAQDDPVREQAMRAAAARQITSAEALRTSEHMLQSFAAMLEPNPRSMKRLVNAFGLNQATQFLEGHSVAPGVLARWTIIELRWPLLADFLSARPHFITYLAEGRKPEDGGVPSDLKKLFGDALVKEVVAGVSSDGASALSEDMIRRIVGLAAAAAAAQTNTAAAPASDPAVKPGPITTAAPESTGAAINRED